MTHASVMRARSSERIQDDTVLLVAGADDGVALKLRAALEETGRNVLHVDGAEAARVFDIRAEGPRTRVTPCVPLVIRASGFAFMGEAADADARFLADECYATLWAAATLSSAAVINRPRASGAIRSLTCGALAQATNAPSEATREIHASGTQRLPSAEHDWWAEDVEARVAPIADLRAGVPIRARRLNANAAYEIVAVIGARAFAATTDGSSRRFDLLRRSVLIARGVGVHFATIWWAIDEQGALPVRLNASPEEHELRYCWQDLIEPLCQDLRS